MKLLTAALTVFGLVLTNVQAANSDTIRVRGVLDRWDVWTIETETSMSGCIAGFQACSETDVPPDSYSGGDDPTQISVEGEISIVDGHLDSLDLVQTQKAEISIKDAKYGKFTISGLHWTLMGNKFVQMPGAISRCSNNNPVCIVNAKSIQDSALDSPFDFDGIPKDFPIQFGAVLLDYHPAVKLERLESGKLSITTSSNQPMSLPVSTIFNSASIFHFTIEEVSTQ
jgi:hypothetical protein